MRHSLSGLGLFLTWLVGSAPVFAASFALTPAQITDAIRTGEGSVTSREFGKEWRVVNARGDSLAVLTPFYRVALAARRAAASRQALKPAEAEAIAKRHHGRLVVQVGLHGARSDFARWYEPALLAAGKPEVRASFVQNERTAASVGDGRYLARCLYAFPVEGLPADGRVTLVVRDRERREMSRFAVDLSTIR
jgi:hypothetical protein